MAIWNTQEKIQRLLRRYVDEVKDSLAMSRKDILTASEIALIPLLGEVFEFRHLRSLNHFERYNFAAIDLGDDINRVAIQVTATATLDKIKETITKFIEYKLYQRYDRLIIYILTEKQSSYSTNTINRIVQNQFVFDTKKDILDHRDILGSISGFEIDRLRRIEKIVEDYFGDDPLSLLSTPVRNQFLTLIRDSNQLFAGRTDVIQKLSQLIENSDKPYIVISAPAGYGKTSLACYLIERMGYTHHFFSPLYGQDSLSETVFLQNIVQQMAEWQDDYSKLPTDLSELRSLYNSRLCNTPLSERKTIILDGIDEINGWNIKPFLPQNLPSNIRIILTVRSVDEEWQSLIPLPSRTLNHIRLNGFNRQQIKEIFQNAGDKASQLIHDGKILDQIVYVTSHPTNPSIGCDPFYIRILAEDAQSGDLNAGNIATQPIGLDNYLDQWWQQIRPRLMGKMQLNHELQKSLRALFGLLAVSLGPIQHIELEAIAPGDLTDPFDLEYLDELIKSSRRFIIGDKQRGYALLHPRLQSYIQSRISIQEHQTLLFAYCANWKQHFSQYALRHYAKHLYQQTNFALLYQLLDQDWMKAKYKLTASHKSFMDDLELAINASTYSSQLDLPQFFATSFQYSKLMSAFSQINIGILGLLVQLGHAEQALGYANLKQDIEVKIKALLHIVLALLANHAEMQARPILEQAIEFHKAINKKDDKLDEIEKQIDLLRMLFDTTSNSQQTALLWLQEYREDGLVGHGELLDEYELNSKVGKNYRAAMQALTLGNLDRSKQFANKLLPKLGSQSLETICIVAKLFFELGEVETATEIVDKLLARLVEEDTTTQWFFDPLRLIQGIISAKQFDQAIKLANSLANPKHISGALGEIALGLFMDRQNDKAYEVLQQAIQAIIFDEDAWPLILLRCKISEALSEVGEMKKALSLAQGAFEDCVIGTYDEEERIESAEWVVQALIKAGEYHDSLDLLLHEGEELAWFGYDCIDDLVNHWGVDYMLRLVDNLKDDMSQLGILISIIRVLVKKGELDQAIAIFDEYKQLERTEALWHLIWFNMKCGDTQQATKLLEQITDAYSLNLFVNMSIQEKSYVIAQYAAEKIENHKIQVCLFSDISEGLFKNGQKHQALHLLKMAEKSYAQIENTTDKAIVSFYLAETNVVMGKYQLGLEQALSALQVIQKEVDKKNFLEFAELATRFTQVLLDCQAVSYAHIFVDSILSQIDVAATQDQFSLAQSVMSRHLAHLQKYEEAIISVEKIEDSERKILSWLEMARIASDQNKSNEVIHFIINALNLARCRGSQSYYETFASCVNPLAKLDKCHTLWHVYETYQKVRM